MIFDALKVTKPWDFEHNPVSVTSDLGLEDQQRIFAVGNKEERQIWKQNYLCDADEICDCCGQSRGKKPWAKNRCNCYSMTYSPRIPWKF